MVTLYKEYRIETEPHNDAIMFSIWRGKMQLALGFEINSTHDNVIAYAKDLIDQDFETPNLEEIRKIPPTYKVG